MAGGVTFIIKNLNFTVKIEEQNKKVFYWLLTTIKDFSNHTKKQFKLNYAKKCGLTFSSSISHICKLDYGFLPHWHLSDDELCNFTTAIFNTWNSNLFKLPPTTTTISKKYHCGTALTNIFSIVLIFLTKNINLSFFIIFMY